MRVLYREFRDEVATTRYPFGDTATLATVADPNLTITFGAFLDASLYPIGAVPPLYLGGVTILPRAVTFTIKDSLNKTVATGVLDPTEPTEVIAFVDAWDRPAGVIVTDVARVTDFAAWPTGAHAFTAAATGFVATCVVPLPFNGVRGILTKNGDLLFGDIWLIGDNGVVLRSTDNRNIRVDVVGDPLFARVLCGTPPLAVFQTPRFILSVNGCTPVRNNYDIAVGDHLNPETALRVYPDGGGLRIELIGDPKTKVNA